VDEPRPRSRRRRLRRIALWGGVLFLAAHLVFWWLVRLPKPDIDVPHPGTPVVEGARATLGDSFLERRDGYWFFLHRGDAVTLGAQHAALGEFLTQRVEDAMFGSFGDHVPLMLRFVLPNILLWQYRHVPDHLPPEQLEELWAFSEIYADRHAFPFSSYRRGLYYHALHDITQELVGNPWVDPAVAGACTGFAATGEATVDGHVIAGRNFDFEVFPLFDEEKVVHLYARDGAIPVLSVSWMAMAGVVTGMNAEGIWISLNAARSEGKNRKGPPVSLWLREILEQARSIDDVERLMTLKAPMVTDIYLVGDGETGEVAVIERGQTRLARRDPGEDGRITAANHLLAPEFEGDAQDAGLRRYSSTLSRGLRMDELVAAEPLSLERALTILRDRSGPGGRELPPGNRNAIDALIATHSAIADLTDRVMWVSTAPHTQGAYRAIDMIAELEAAGVDATAYRATLAEGARAWEREPPQPLRGEETGDASLPTEPALPPAPPRDLPTGDLLDGDGLATLERYRGYLRDTEAYLDDDQPSLALVMVERLEALLPGVAETELLRAKACQQLDDQTCAREAFTAYLERWPSYGPEHHRAVEWLREHGSVPDVGRPDLP
jgi:isopenicillin-N N-acyltransferase like protein